MKRQTIVWAMDPIEEETKPDQALVQDLLNWARSTDQEVQPVHVLSIPKYVNDTFFEDGGEARLSAAVARASGSYLREIGARGVNPIQVLVSSGSSRKDDVARLIRFAEEKNASCIVVSSHGRSGVQRLLLGSFAENLLLSAHCPVVFLSHRKQPVKAERISKALFATDFSEYSGAAFSHFLLQAKRQDLEIVIFNSVNLPATALGANYGEPLAIPDDYFENLVKWAKEDGARWVRLAEANGVRAKLIVKDEGVNPDVAKSILSAAEQEGAQLIAMASVSGPVKSFVLGSVAREVFRANRYPVWVCGPLALENERGGPRAQKSASA